MQEVNLSVNELTHDSPCCHHPENVKIKMWPHQLTLLHRCKQFERESIPLNTFPSLQQLNRHQDDVIKTQVGIIADSVGSGKSFVILALALESKTCQGPRQEKTVQTFGNNMVAMFFTDQVENINTTLLVIPHNLVSQWTSYISSFSDDLTFDVIAKSVNLKKLVREGCDYLRSLDLLIVTSSFYSSVAQVIVSKSIKLRRIVYDEIDNMHLPSCMHINSNFYWFVTATYGNLLFPKGLSRYDYSTYRTIWYAEGLKNSGFVKDLFIDMSQNVSSDFSKLLVLKNNDDFIKQSISLPAPRTQYILCKTPFAIRTLSGYVNSEILRSLNAGDINTALRLISPTQVSSEEHIVAIQIKRLERQFQNTCARIEFTNTLEFDDENTRNIELQRLNKLKDELQTKMDGINVRIKNSNVCSICYDDISTKSISPCCSNAFCFKCINVWLISKQVCPFCKASISPKNMMVVSGKNGNNDATSNVMHDKITSLKNILQKIRNNGKVIIYSAYDSSFDKIVSLLQSMDITYNFLKGNDGQLRGIINRYKNGKLSVLLANTRYYGSGLNLENTTDIIMFHKFDSEMEKQVIGRAQRYGRTSVLNVWYLLYENEHSSNTSSTSVTTTV